jgi:hypothetical protein
MMVFQKERSYADWLQIKNQTKKMFNLEEQGGKIKIPVQKDYADH